MPHRFQDLQSESITQPIRLVTRLSQDFSEDIHLLRHACFIISSTLMALMYLAGLADRHRSNDDTADVEKASGSFWGQSPFSRRQAQGSVVA
jgi:hypothetical protein